MKVIRESAYLKHFKVLTYVLFLDADYIERLPGRRLRISSTSEFALTLSMQNTRVRRSFEALEALGLISDLHFAYNTIECRVRAPLPW